MKRRGFLKLLASAPIAAPVVAKEAAVAAGMTSIGPDALLMANALGDTHSLLAR